MNKPAGTHAVNERINALQDLQRYYDVLRARRALYALRALDSRAEALAEIDRIECGLTGLRQRAAKLINQLNPSDVAWKRAFGLL